MDKIKCHAGVRAALEVIGGKWKPVILWHLAEGRLRFSGLQKSLPGISQKILTQQLRELESDGIIHREVYKQIPPKVEYWTTAYGQTLYPILQKMGAWGRQHLDKHHNK